MIVLNCCSLFSLTSLESFLNSNLVLLLKINLNQVILYFRKGQVRSCDSSAVAGHCFIRIESSSVPCFPCGSAGEESACNAGHLGSIPGLGRSPGEGKGYPLQYSGLENSMNSMGLQTVGHDWTTFTSTVPLRMGVLTCFSCVWICDPMNCSPPGFSIHGPLKARLLEWVSMLFSRGSSWPRDWTLVSFITGRFSIDRVTGEAPLQYFISPDMWCWQILCKGPECK